MRDLCIGPHVHLFTPKTFLLTLPQLLTPSMILTIFHPSEDHFVSQPTDIFCSLTLPKRFSHDEEDPRPTSTYFGHIPHCTWLLHTAWYYSADLAEHSHQVCFRLWLKPLQKARVIDGQLCPYNMLPSFRERLISGSVCLSVRGLW